MDTTLLPAGLAPVIAMSSRSAISGVRPLYMHGSRARGDHRPDSDLDVTVAYDAAKFSLHDLVGVQHIIGDGTGLMTHVATQDPFKEENRSRFEAELVGVL